MSTPQSVPELHHLVEAVLDETVSEDQWQRLRTLLKDDGQARRYYLDRVALHSLLHGDSLLTSGFSIASEDEQDKSLSASPSAELPGAACVSRPASEAASGGAVARYSFVVLTGGALAAAAVLVVSLSWFGLFSTVRDTAASSSPSTIARIVDEVGAEWSQVPDRDTLEGSLSPGWVHLRSGRARLEMTSGAQLALSAPVSLELLDAKAVRLHRGNLSVNVPEKAIGFRVLTADADVVDLGTEFGVSVEEGQATEVHVLRGAVVARALSNSDLVPILAQEAGRFDNKYDGVFSIPVNASRFASVSSEISSSPQLTEPKRPAKLGSYSPLPPASRVIFLGDRVTDSEMHILFVEQALEDLPASQQPMFYNAALALFLSFREEGFQRYVAPYRPTHAVLEFGSEIASQGEKARTPEQFRRHLLRLIKRLEKAGIQPILETGFPLPAKYERFQARLDQYNEIIRELAQQRGYRLVDAEAHLTAAREAGFDVLHNKYVRPTYEGYRCIAEAILEGLGYSKLSVPETLSPELLPGVIQEWQIRFLPDREPLTAQEVAELEVDDSWRKLSIPQQPDRLLQRLGNQSSTAIQRQRGFATHLFSRGSKGFVAIAEVEADAARSAWLNIGGGTSTVWLNGKRVYAPSDGHHGVHPGGQRIPIDLQQGTNRVVLEAGNRFFVSITDQRDWPLQ